MEIVMFILFLMLDLITVLVCKFAYGDKDKYVNGMLMGVHIPSNEVTNPEVREICEKNRKNWKKFHWISFITGGAICIICFWRFELFMIIWLVWLFTYIVGIDALVLIPHRRMYQLKLKNHWVNEKSKHIICIDTEVSALSNKIVYNWKWHLPIMVIFLGTGIWMFKDAEWFMKKSSGWIVYIIVWMVAFIMLFLHLWITYKQNVVYSQNTKINFAVNRLVKRMWSIALLTVNWINGISWCYLIIRIIQNEWLGGGDYGVYIFLHTIGILGFVIPILYMHKKKQELLTDNTEPIYIDDDEYWKNGWYSNPNDPHILVQDRMSSTNFAFNMAHRSVKIICSVLAVATVAVVIWVVTLLLSLMNLEVIFEINQNEVYLQALNYECKFSISEIEEVAVIQNMPDENFIRTNGASTDENNVGHFKGKETGNCMMFLYREYAPILKITLADQIVFVNSEKPGEVQEWYRELESKKK